MKPDKYDYKVYRKELFSQKGSEILDNVRCVAQAMLTECGAFKGILLLNKFRLMAHPNLLRAAVDYLEEINFLRRIYGTSDVSTGNRIYIKGT